MNIDIREARETDLPAIIELFAQLGKERMSLDDARNRLEMIRSHPEMEMWLAVEGETPVGMYTFRIRHNVERVSYYGEITAVVVDAAHRGAGVGRQLVAHADRRARDHGCIGLWLVSANHRQDAHRFYKELGFDPSGTRFVRDF